MTVILHTVRVWVCAFNMTGRVDRADIEARKPTLCFGRPEVHSMLSATQHDVNSVVVMPKQLGGYV